MYKIHTNVFYYTVLLWVVNWIEVGNAGNPNPSKIKSYWLSSLILT